MRQTDLVSEFDHYHIISLYYFISHLGLFSIKQNLHFMINIVVTDKAFSNYSSQLCLAENIISVELRKK